MCGRADFLGFAVLATNAPALLTRVAETLVHRGPDDQGIWSDPANGIGRFVISYNGEVYKPAEPRAEPRAELVALGHTFRGGSDTEVMLVAFEQWGLQGVVPRFVGMSWLEAERRQTSSTAGAI